MPLANGKCQHKRKISSVAKSPICAGSRELCHKGWPARLAAVNCQANHIPPISANTQQDIQAGVHDSAGQRDSTYSQPCTQHTKENTYVALKTDANWPAPISFSRAMSTSSMSHIPSSSAMFNPTTARRDGSTLFVGIFRLLRESEKEIDFSRTLLQVVLGGFPN